MTGPGRRFHSRFSSHVTPRSPGGFRAGVLGVFLAGVLALRASDGQPMAEAYDVVVYGGSSAGVIAAAKASHLGKSTILISAHSHIGGMTASGLGATDVGNAETIGGLARRFYERVHEDFVRTTVAAGSTSGVAERAASDAAGVKYEFEPHVAETIFREMLRQSGAAWVQNEPLDRVSGVMRAGSRIVALRTKSGRIFHGRVFIDASYEGDLLAAAGVSYRVGRESRDQYGESVAGVWRDPELTGEVDPYRVPGDPGSGVLPGVSLALVGPDGSGDSRVQQYNFRMCVTMGRENGVPFQRPVDYDPANYELMRRRLLKDPTMPFAWVLKVQPLPNGKYDVNATGSFSTDMAGDDSSRWAEASDEERQEILRKYRNYTEGLLWFLAHEPSVPAHIRDSAAQLGLAADEFTDNGNWPWHLYVREARRMVGAYLMTQHDCDGRTVAPDPVALGSYSIDCHKVTLFVDEHGRLNTEGYFSHGVSPYRISYRALVPAPWECTNLLVPICVSATHAAFNSLRMEPVYMMLGQAAGTAASLAIDHRTTVQAVNYAALAHQLRADGAILKWPRTVAEEERRRGWPGRRITHPE